MKDIKPMIQEYIRLVGRVYPGQIPFTNPNYSRACKLHDDIRSIERADPNFKFSANSWQEHLDSVA